MDNICKIIKTERLNKNLTQKELAEQLGVTQDSISLWEKGKRIPDTQYILSMCKIFEISADYFLGLDDDFGTRTVAPIKESYTAEERQLIDDYRTLSPNLKKMVKDTIKTFTTSEENTKRKHA